MRSKRSGFALLEVLIAFVLIGVASLALVNLQVYGAQQADYAAKSLQALNHIESKLEWFRTRGASAELSTIGVADFSQLNHGSELDAKSAITLSWQIESADSSLSSSLKVITLTAQWQQRSGEHQQVRLKTMLASIGEFNSK